MYVSPKTLPLCIKSLSNAVSFNGNKIQIRFSLCISYVRKTTFHYSTHSLLHSWLLYWLTLVICFSTKIHSNSDWWITILNFKRQSRMQGTMAEFEKICLKNLIDNMNFEYCVWIKHVFQIVKIFALNNEKIFRTFHQISDFLKWSFKRELSKLAIVLGASGYLVWSFSPVIM